MWFRSKKDSSARSQLHRHAQTLRQQLQGIELWHVLEFARQTLCGSNTRAYQSEKKR